jgi:hypothetical protein
LEARYIPRVCVECGTEVAVELLDINGAALCEECAALYYVACAGCGGLVPREESRARDEKVYCAGCFTKSDEAGVDLPPDEEIESLVDEYITLYAQEKKISERLDTIKERLKAAAAVRERIAGAVVFRSDQGEVRCAYSIRPRWDFDKLASLEPVMGEERFASLFERAVSYKANKKSVEEFLSGTDEASRSLREAVRDAMEEIETPSLSVPRRKK